MSLARRKRLERLEARQPRGRPWFDPFTPPPLAFLEAMRDYDVMHTRLTTSRGPLARLRRIVAYIGSTYLSGHHR